ncbi:MAG: RadC family protein [Methylococcaceae bacterium]
MLFIQEANGEYRAADEDDVISEATQIYGSYFAKGTLISEPADSADYLKLKLAQYDHEVFICLFLDTRHRVISCDEMSHGTIDQANVYPREIIKATLRHNASAVIFAHNHPSGLAEPSDADKRITAKLKNALETIDVKVLDHIIIGDGTYSFAEKGIL